MVQCHRHRAEQDTNIESDTVRATFCKVLDIRPGQEKACGRADAAARHRPSIKDVRENSRISTLGLRLMVAWLTIYMR